VENDLRLHIVFYSKCLKGSQTHPIPSSKKGKSRQIKTQTKKVQTVQSQSQSELKPTFSDFDLFLLVKQLKCQERGQKPPKKASVAKS